MKNIKMMKEIIRINSDEFDIISIRIEFTIGANENKIMKEIDHHHELPKHF